MFSCKDTSDSGVHANRDPLDQVRRRVALPWVQPPMRNQGRRKDNNKAARASANGETVIVNGGIHLETSSVNCAAQCAAPCCSDHQPVTEHTHIHTHIDTHTHTHTHAQ